MKYKYMGNPIDFTRSRCGFAGCCLFGRIVVGDLRVAGVKNARKSFAAFRYVPPRLILEWKYLVS